ncbi:hypothetical protein X975_25292, partial [Stegodyphus mimosarum]
MRNSLHHLFRFWGFRITWRGIEPVMGVFGLASVDSQTKFSRTKKICF